MMQYRSLVLRLRTLVVLVALMAAAQASAQTVPDTLAATPALTLTAPDSTAQPMPRIDRLTSTRLYQMTYIGVPLVAAGLLVKGQDAHFRGLRHDYLPEYRNHVDDGMQFLPGLVMIGLKTAGVESRSSWGRMMASGALSAVIMGSVVESIKLTSKVERPDGSDNHSFPSGHTATAFMTATMLSKEYGHLSPWVGIGAYSVATTTGLMRVVNNKHWLSDVLTGAGIGIISTELGYWVADRLFRDHGITHHSTAYTLDMMRRPSFLGIYVGMNIPLSKYDIDEQHEFRTSAGSTAGVEGAYFFTPYVGVGRTRHRDQHPDYHRRQRGRRPHLRCRLGLCRSLLLAAPHPALADRHQGAGGLCTLPAAQTQEHEHRHPRQRHLRNRRLSHLPRHRPLQRPFLRRLQPAALPQPRFARVDEHPGSRTVVCRSHLSTVATATTPVTTTATPVTAAPRTLHGNANALRHSPRALHGDTSPIPCTGCRWGKIIRNFLPKDEGSIVFSSYFCKRSRYVLSARHY